MGTRPMKQKLENCRFRKTEEAIFGAFFSESHEVGLSVDGLTKKIGINRTTFYRHHRAACKVVEDYEKYILEKYEELLRGIENRGDLTLRKLYYEILVFILRNQRVFEVLIKRRDLRIIEGMVVLLRPGIGDAVEILGRVDRVFRVYTGEIVGLIEDWGIRGFEGKEVVVLLDNIMYLTETSGARLLPLAN